MKEQTIIFSLLLLTLVYSDCVHDLHNQNASRRFLNDLTDGRLLSSTKRERFIISIYSVWESLSTTPSSPSEAKPKSTWSKESIISPQPSSTKSSMLSDYLGFIIQKINQENVVFFW